MKLYIFGTCAGTEPMPGRHHVSFAVQHAGGLYWFDAGENCSYTAHTMGVDLMQLRKVVISHTHMDHMGGLGNLFWNLRKLDNMYHTLACREVELFIPDLRPWQGVRTLLEYTEGGFACDFTIAPHEITDGPLFCDQGLTVTALHNHHLAHEQGAPWRSFGFAIEAQGKRVVYTGDTKGLADFAPLLAGGCDLLLHETGHHHPVEVAQGLLDAGAMPKRLAFIHHGRDLLYHYDDQCSQLRALLGERFVVLEDGQTLEL